MVSRGRSSSQRLRSTHFLALGRYLFKSVEMFYAEFLASSWRVSQLSFAQVGIALESNR